jgi:hypothetical protein
MDDDWGYHHFRKPPNIDQWRSCTFIIVPFGQRSVRFLKALGILSTNQLMASQSQHDFLE